jgi:DNA-directed RNA polymerase III subunit RPC8
MDKKYPNRVIMDMGLVICRYGDALQVGDGVCAAGDGGAHHEVIVRLVVFRPFVEEVCLGTILKSSEEGIQISMGFFDDVFIPAYWMLRPSHYDKDTGLWVWTPDYGEEEEEEESNKKMEENGGNMIDGENRFEMEIGAEIRFKVKSINFTRVTNTAKGVQATTTTTSHSISAPSVERALSVGSASETDVDSLPVRRRSTSVDLSDSLKVPASMHIIASICEDGLGLTNWWASEEAGGKETEVRS